MADCDTPGKGSCEHLDRTAWCEVEQLVVLLRRGPLVLYEFFSQEQSFNLNLLGFEYVEALASLKVEFHSLAYSNP